MSKRAFNIINGMGSVLEIFPPSQYNTKISRRSPTDDFKNLRGDWRQVGMDIFKAMQKFNDKKDKKEG